MSPTPTSAGRRAALLLAPLALALAALAGCSSDADDPVTATTTTTSATETTAPDGDTTTTTTGDDPDPDRTTTTEGSDEPAPEPDGDDVVPTAEEQPYVDALEAALESEDNTDLPLDADTAACVAPRWVRTIGVEGFTAADVAPDDLNAATDGDRRSYFDAIADLGDPASAQELVGAFDPCGVDLLDLILELLGGPSGLTDEQRTCFADLLTTADVEAGLADALDGDDEQTTTFEDDITTAGEACLFGEGG